jgi:hypothetical protein
MTDYIDAVNPGNSSYFGYAQVGKAQFGRKWVRYRYDSQIIETRFNSKNGEVKHKFRSTISEA